MKTFSVKLRGPVTLAFTKSDDDTYLCNALQFDIVGTGRTEKEAEAQVRDLVTGYLRHVLSLIAAGKKVRFFNPADEAEWNNAYWLQNYDVFFKFIVKTDRNFNLDEADGIEEAEIESAESIEKIAEYTEEIEDVELVLT